MTGMEHYTDTITQVEGTTYTWRHHSCRCLGHCNVDELFVDGEQLGRFDNGELCIFVSLMQCEIERLRNLCAELGAAEAKLADVEAKVAALNERVDYLQPALEEEQELHGETKIAAKYNFEQFKLANEQLTAKVAEQAQTIKRLNGVLLNIRLIAGSSTRAWHLADAAINMLKKHQFSSCASNFSPVCPEREHPEHTKDCPLAALVEGDKR